MKLFFILLHEVCDPKKVRASGRGLQPTGVRCKDIADFKIHTDGAGEGIPNVTILGPGGINTPHEIKSVNNQFKL